VFRFKTTISCTFEDFLLKELYHVHGKGLDLKELYLVHVKSLDLKKNISFTREEF